MVREREDGTLRCAVTQQRRGCARTTASRVAATPRTPAIVPTASARAAARSAAGVAATSTRATSAASVPVALISQAMTWTRSDATRMRSRKRSVPWRTVPDPPASTTAKRRGAKTVVGCRRRAALYALSLAAQ